MEKKETPKIFQSLVGEDKEISSNNQPQESMFEAIASKVIEELLSSTTNLKMKSDLNVTQITAVTKAYVYADQYKSKLVKYVADTLLELMVSKSRLGRTEMTGLVRSLSEYSRMDEGRSRMDILTGKGL